jgi:hypothetical protein
VGEIGTSPNNVAIVVMSGGNFLSNKIVGSEMMNPSQCNLHLFRDLKRSLRIQSDLSSKANDIGRAVFTSLSLFLVADQEFDECWRTRLCQQD